MAVLCSTWLGGECIPDFFILIFVMGGEFFGGGKWSGDVGEDGGDACR